MLTRIYKRDEFDSNFPPFSSPSLGADSGMVPLGKIQIFGALLARALIVDWVSGECFGEVNLERLYASRPVTIRVNPGKDEYPVQLDGLNCHGQYHRVSNIY